METSSDKISTNVDNSKSIGDEKKYFKIRTINLKNLLKRTVPSGTQQFLTEIPAGSNYTFYVNSSPYSICNRRLDSGWHMSSASFSEHLKVADLLACDYLLLTESQNTFVCQARKNKKSIK